jgi:hypothetical protein
LNDVDDASGANGGCAPLHRPPIGASAPIFLPVRNSASAMRRLDDKFAPCAFRIPLVSASTMKLGDITPSEARAGARVAGLLWQTAQFCSNSTSSPAGDGPDWAEAP